MIDSYLAMVFDGSVVELIPFEGSYWLEALVRTARAAFGHNTSACTMRLYWAHEIDMVFVDVDDPDRTMRERESKEVNDGVVALIREL